MIARRHFLLLACALVIPFGSLRAQQTTVSGRIKVIDEEHQKRPAHDNNAVVWLNPLDAQSPPRRSLAGPLRLTQHNKSFVPHLLVVPVGAVVEFPNRDPFFHNVFSLFEGKRFDLGLYEAGSTRNVSFDRQGVSYIFCNIHAEMSAVVIALDTPYYGISGRNGEVVISNVPAGRYLMRVWYETALPATLNRMSREVDITPDNSTLGTLEIPAATVNAHKNKYGMDYEPPPPSSPYDHP